MFIPYLVNRGVEQLIEDIRKSTFVPTEVLTNSCHYVALRL